MMGITYYMQTFKDILYFCGIHNLSIKFLNMDNRCAIKIGKDDYLVTCSFPESSVLNYNFNKEFSFILESMINIIKYRYSNINDVPEDFLVNDIGAIFEIEICHRVK